MDLHPEIVAVSDGICLRPLAAGDARAIAAGLSDWAVTQWLTHVPFPYALSDAEWFLGNEASRGAMAVVVNDAFAGAVHIGSNGMLGYWLVRTHHGQGIMTRAAVALVRAHFARDGGPLTSGYHIGNTASCNVLEKLGFRVTGHSLVRTARGDDVVLRRMILTARDWQNRPQRTQKG
jgi:[ribosomal protein S5]-alanine N-acetyltransferase